MPDGSVVRASQVQLVQYEAARQAVAECVRIDEAAEIMDKAAAMAAYARQRDDKQLEGWLAEIKCRAVVKIGGLSRKLDASRGGANPKATLPAGGKSKAAVLADAKISTSAAQRYEAVAEADEAEPTRGEKYYVDCKAQGKAPTLGGLRNALKGDRRRERETELAAKTARASEQLGSTLYPVIYADPPWRFQPYSDKTGMDRAADNHYPTVTVEKLCEMKVPAAADAVLFLWATVPMLPEALDVMKAWGFAYKSHFVWLKDRPGTGYWNRNKHELLLVGTRGKIPAPAPGDQYESVIAARVGKHSAKPAHFAEVIDEMFPQLAGIEMFARGPRLGWDVWGNEVPAA